MKKKIFIVANWKMNLSISDSAKLIKALKKINFNQKLIKVIICPQFLLIPKVSELLKKNKISLGAQDCHYSLSGAFTGDNSCSLLKFFGCKYVILGHSERRQYHNEKYLTVKQKIITANALNIKPIVCVGESLKERQIRNYKLIIINQLKKCIPDNITEVIVAYEPIWSIGTGIIPKHNEIKEISNLIFNFFSKKKIKVNILYGGSVNVNNFNEILSIKNICGGLVGGASLDSNQLTEMIEKI